MSRSKAPKQERIELRHRLEFWAWRGAEWLALRLSRRALVRLADLCGLLLYEVLRARRRVTEENLQRAFGDSFPPTKLRAIARRAYQNAVLTFFECLQSRYYGPLSLCLFKNGQGLEHLEKARGSAAVFVTAHSGNWELFGQAVQAMGFECDAVMKPLHNPLINAYVVAQRQAGGVRLIPTSGALKGIVTALRAGRHPVFLADQDARRDGIFVRFLGHPASTALGPAYFAYKFRVPIYAGFCVRNEDPERTLSFVIMPPIEPDCSMPEEVELRRLTEAHVRALEQVVRAYPESYFWLHRRWKTKPKAEDLAADQE